MLDEGLLLNVDWTHFYCQVIHTRPYEWNNLKTFFSPTRNNETRTGGRETRVRLASRRHIVMADESGLDDVTVSLAAIRTQNGRSSAPGVERSIGWLLWR